MFTFLDQGVIMIASTQEGSKMKIKVRIGSVAFVVDQIDGANNLICLEYSELQCGVCSPTLEESVQMMGDFLKKEYNLEGEIL